MRLLWHLKPIVATLLMMTMVRCFALTDLAQAPINFLLATPVKPNIYFILDDSGSMAGAASYPVHASYQQPLRISGDINH